MIKWKNYYTVINYLKNNKLFSKCISFYFSNKHILSTIGAGSRQIIYIYPKVVSTIKSQYGTWAFIPENQFQTILINKLEEIIPSTFSKVCFILLQTDAALIVNESKICLDGGVPHLTTFMKQRNNFQYIRSFNVFLEKIVKKHWINAETISPENMIDCMESVISRVQESPENNLNFFTSSYPYQLLIALSCYYNKIDEFLFKQKIFNKTVKCIDAIDQEYPPMYFSIDVALLIKLIKQTFPKIDLPIENFAAALCLTGLSHCRTIRGLIVNAFLDATFSLFLKGDQILVKDDYDDYSFTESIKSILLTCSSINEKDVEMIIKDYEELLNDDLLS